MRILWRVRDRNTFVRLRRSRTRARAGSIAVTRAPLGPEVATSGGAHPAVAFAVSRKVGTAVVRNRVRRQLRATLRDLDLPAAAYLVRVAADAGQRSVDRVRGDLVEALAALPPMGRTADGSSR